MLLNFLLLVSLFSCVGFAQQFGFGIKGGIRATNDMEGFLWLFFTIARTCLLFAIVANPVCAQFADLAATADGRQLYFSSVLSLSGEPLRLTGTGIYRIAETGLELFADGASSPQVSASGQTVGLTRNANGELLGAGADLLGVGRLHMSRNAKWATLTNFVGAPLNGGSYQSSLISLENGARTMLPQSVVLSAQFPLASNGMVVLDGAMDLGTWRQGNFTPLTIRGPYSIFAISDNARVLVYSQHYDPVANPLLQRLVVRDLEKGTDTILFPRGAPGGVTPLGISDDGRLVLFRTSDGSKEGKAFLSNITTGDTTAIPLPEGELCTDGALSGDGSRAFLVTTASRIISVDAASGQLVQTLVQPTPYVPFFPLLVPGSRARLRGTTLPRTVDALAGRLLLDEVVIPILYANSFEIGIQVPWELKAPGRSSFRVAGAGLSRFVQNPSVQITPMLFNFEPLVPGEMSFFPFKVFRGDFGGFQTTNPKPGDIIIAYASGLGPVRESIRSGESAPLDRTVEIVGQLHCRFSPYPEFAETLFAGLAPGLIGIYQVNFRLPPGPDLGPIQLVECKYSGSGAEGTIIFLAPH